ncbi:hypothetical protein C8Q80DRAFT_1122970 [Daedaleopsis nitida]|nr:hypothetical protein C8Q80DRAFT_1122970 [Daedaleopsis nitida]
MLLAALEIILTVLARVEIVLSEPQRAAPTVPHRRGSYVIRDLVLRSSWNYDCIWYLHIRKPGLMLSSLETGKAVQRLRVLTRVRVRLAKTGLIGHARAYHNAARAWAARVRTRNQGQVLFWSLVHGDGYRKTIIRANIKLRPQHTRALKRTPDLDDKSELRHGFYVQAHKTTSSPDCHLYLSLSSLSHSTIKTNTTDPFHATLVNGKKASAGEVSASMLANINFKGAYTHTLSWKTVRSPRTRVGQAANPSQPQARPRKKTPSHNSAQLGADKTTTHSKSIGPSKCDPKLVSSILAKLPSLATGPQVPTPDLPLAAASLSRSLYSLLHISPTLPAA